MDTVTVSFTVERDDESGETKEVKLEITGSHSPVVPARRGGHPDTWTPEEGGETEIENITILNTELSHLFDELTEDETEAVKQEIVNNWSSRSDVHEREHDDDPGYYD